MLALQKLNQARENLNEAAAELERIVASLGLLGAPTHGIPLGKSKPVALPATLRKELGGKRDPELLEQLTASLHEFIRKHPGKRIEHIAAEMGLPTKSLVLPVRKLREAKRISIKGTRRATTYYPKG